jgi:hypothetical protein
VVLLRIARSQRALRVYQSLSDDDEDRILQKQD